MSWLDDLKIQLMQHEGWRAKPYRDTKNKLTIGFGRNLEDTGIDRAEGAFLLDNDIRRAVEALDREFPEWTQLSPIRQRVVADMMYNLGPTKFLGFKKMLAALKARQFDRAADEMEDSDWYHQVGRRAVRLVAMMRSNRDIPQGAG